MQTRRSSKNRRAVKKKGSFTGSLNSLSDDEAPQPSQGSTPTPQARDRPPRSLSDSVKSVDTVTSYLANQGSVKSVDTVHSQTSYLANQGSVKSVGTVHSQTSYLANQGSVKSVDSVTAYLAAKIYGSPVEEAVELGIPLGISFAGTPQHGCFVYNCKEGGNAELSGSVTPGVCARVHARVCVRACVYGEEDCLCCMHTCTSASTLTAFLVYRVCAEW